MRSSQVIAGYYGDVCRNAMILHHVDTSLGPVLTCTTLCLQLTAAQAQACRTTVCDGSSNCCVALRDRWWHSLAAAGFSCGPVGVVLRGSVGAVNYCCCLPVRASRNYCAAQQVCWLLFCRPKCMTASAQRCCRCCRTTRQQRHRCSSSRHRSSCKASAGAQAQL